MAYLDNTEIVDAILTKKGEKSNEVKVLILQDLLLGDDEIDYGLYELGSSKGSAFYDVKLVKAIPVLEDHQMKHKH